MALSQGCHCKRRSLYGRKGRGREGHPRPPARWPARRLRKYGGKWGKRRRLRIRKLGSVLCLHELPRLCRTLRERKLRLREPVSSRVSKGFVPPQVIEAFFFFTNLFFFDGDMTGPINKEIFPMYVKVQGREGKQESASTVWPGSPSMLQHCTSRRRSFRSREFKPILRLLRRDIG